LRVRYGDDRRYLGILVGTISQYESGRTYLLEDRLEKPALFGRQDLESRNVRWTNGKALIPLGAREHNSHALLAIKVIEAGPYVIPHKICPRENIRAASS